MTGLRWTLDVRAPTPMRSTNQFRRMHWSQIARERRDWRHLSVALAQGLMPVGLERVRIDAVLHFTDRRGRDEANFYDVIKPAVDALGPPRTVKDRRQPGGFRVEPGHGLIPDDTPKHLDGPHLSIGEPVDRLRYPYGLAVLTITDLSGDADA